MNAVSVSLFVALILLSATLIFLVVLQGRTAGLQSRDTSSVYRTKRGLEKTLHQATIALGILFLVLSLIASLPIFGTQ
ncbi:MAG TPA: preprotein translocase subunit SecG [Roseiflexaceae bacterium]|nr:preprotein translocase subunit SecG [Roseiflexaceae bacterium]HMP40697.1 preprotein translocase subunit SecG [Roseiflexaceae bacterium]